MIVAAVVFTSMSKRPSDQQIEQALRPGNAFLFADDGRARFHVTKVIEAQPGWYVVTIELDDVETEPGKVILRQYTSPDGPLTVVAGPGTSFPPDSVSLPDAVREALPK
ncbi:MAG: hypothetical protein WAM92_00895 [Mycobacterium sp.]